MYKFVFNVYELRLIKESLQDFQLYCYNSSFKDKDVICNDVGVLLDEIEKKIKD